MNRRKLWDKMQEIRDKMKDETLLRDIFNYFSVSDMEECLTSISDDYDLEVFNEEDEEDEEDEEGNEE